MLRNKEYFIAGYKDWRKELRAYKYFIFLSLMVFVIATFIDYLSGVYVTSAETAHVPDLILDHIGPIDVSFLFIWGYIAFFSLLFLYPIFLHVRTLHIVISQFSLLIMLRAVFVLLTHLQTPPDAIIVDFPWKFQVLSFQNDMFFSGHTAIPFLGFLLFKRPIRYFFLFGSILMGAVVLLIHIHFSIDVFGAFFMTYGSYKIGNLLIRKAEHYIRS
ncbi:MAG: hypothetical protein P8016_03385 [Sedimentisphaerales bacterium]